MTAGASLRARLDAERALLDLVRGDGGPSAVAITTGAGEVRVDVSDDHGCRTGSGPTFADAWAAARRGPGR